MIEYPNIDPVAISIPISGFWGESIKYLLVWAGICSWGLSDLPANAPNKEQI